MKKRIWPETDRLLLKPFELSDASRVKELAGERAIANSTLNVPHPYKLNINVA
jgi:hypothetical protein